jgi:hypothetical protein
MTTDFSLACKLILKNGVQPDTFRGDMKATVARFKRPTGTAADSSMATQLPSEPNLAQLPPPKAKRTQLAVHFYDVDVNGECLDVERQLELL